MAEESVESVKRNTVTRPKEFEKAGRPNMFMGLSTNVQLRDPSEWAEKNISPMDMFTDWSSYNVNFSNGEGSKKGFGGGDGNIEENHLADVRIRTWISMLSVTQAEQSANKDKEAEDERSVPAILMQPVSYLPLDMKDEKGHTAFDILMNKMNPDFDKYLKIRKGLSDAVKKCKERGDDKNLSRNADQIHALDAAMVAVFSDGKLSDGFTLNEAVKAIETKEDVEKAFGTYKGNDLAMIKVAVALKVKDKTLYEKIVACKNDPSLANGSDPYIDIYKDNPKTPDLRKVGNEWRGIDKDGFTKCYRLSVRCFPKHKYPYVVTLKTMKGHPLEWDASTHKMRDGVTRAAGIEERNAIDVQTFTIALESWEWNNFAEKAWLIEANTFALGYPKAYNMMMQFIEENYKSWKKN